MHVSEYHHLSSSPHWILCGRAGLVGVNHYFLLIRFTWFRLPQCLRLKNIEYGSISGPMPFNKIFYACLSWELYSMIIQWFIPCIIWWRNFNSGTSEFCSLKKRLLNLQILKMGGISEFITKLTLWSWLSDWKKHQSRNQRRKTR